MQCCLAPVTLFHVCIMLLWACIIMCQICITLYSASILWFNVEKKTQTCSLTVPSLSLLAHVYIIYRSVKHFDLHLYENVPDSSTWTRLVFMTCSAIHTCQWSGPHTQSSDCETVCDNVKNARSSDINFVPIQQSNKSGDGALFNYGDALIVSASVKVGVTKCITVCSLPS